MGLDFLKRVRKTATVSGSVLAALVAVYAGAEAGLAFAAGAAWSLLNLLVIEMLVRHLVADGDRRRLRRLRIAGVAMIKIPVLYALGFLLVRSELLPVTGLLAGFIWPLAVIVMKALGRLVLRLDDGGAQRRAVE